ncbi:hypothetical protein KO525_05295 [Psychrosphaera sp. B3R10]|uniref:hypothetical protein n=1 Tax=unclassified Psychrosphaera TaxID=2641570 RepID=UPI001C0946FF|nr:MULTISPECIES: hypothetical protein [unclassified Psychrosphaera]MBU2881997.1 hypothetical protein [Psychrosphaera sp. I2R16]MBU2988789.1 hypothetical protein [Psychrosphaera sp. B3R10]
MSHIEQFCESAIAKGDGTSLNDSEHFSKMQEAITHVTELPNLLPLLNHKNEWVVCWAASHLLANGYSSEALKSLNKLATGTGIASFSADITIQEYKRGCFKSPFG